MLVPHVRRNSLLLQITNTSAIIIIHVPFLNFIVAWQVTRLLLSFLSTIFHILKYKLYLSLSLPFFVLWFLILNRPVLKPLSLQPPSLSLSFIQLLLLFLNPAAQIPQLDVLFVVLNHQLVGWQLVIQSRLVRSLVQGLLRFWRWPRPLRVTHFQPVLRNWFQALVGRALVRARTVLEGMNGVNLVLGLVEAVLLLVVWNVTAHIIILRSIGVHF